MRSGIAVLQWASEEHVLGLVQWCAGELGAQIIHGWPGFFSTPPSSHPSFQGFAPGSACLFIAAPKQELRTFSSHPFSTIQHPSKLLSSAHASSPNVCNLWKLIQGFLTCRPPMDYLSTHLLMPWVQRPLKARMMNGAEITGLHWVREENVLASAQWCPMPWHGEVCPCGPSKIIHSWCGGEVWWSETLRLSKTGCRQMGLQWNLWAGGGSETLGLIPTGGRSICRNVER